MNAMAWAYLAYVVICVGVTIWVASTLRRHGTAFLIREESERERTDSLVHLLIVGFYLVNLGIISFMLRMENRVTDVQTGFELLSTKIGTVLVILGAMHFLILAVFSKSRRNEDEEFERAQPHAISDLLSQRQQPSR